jgi:hypothetical protein
MDDRDPEFEDFETTIMAGGVGIPVRVTADALHGIWGFGVGPQTADAIFGENRPLFDEVIANKLLAGDVSNGVVVISDADLDI